MLTDTLTTHEVHVNVSDVLLFPSPPRLKKKNMPDCRLKCKQKRMQDFKILVFMLKLMLCPSSLGYIKLLRKGAKKVSFTACHSGKL